MLQILATIMPFLAISMAASIPARDGNGLSMMVPPPSCLDQCIKKLNGCTLCETNNTYSPCINSSCGYRDVSYANAYYSSICEDGGYLNYDTDPHSVFYIASDPRTSCPNAHGNGTKTGH